MKIEDSKSNKNNLIEKNLLNQPKQEPRITVFVCCDKKYSIFIPLFCATMLYSDKRNRTDIEIGISMNELPNNTEEALKYLRERFPNSKILVRYSLFKSEGKDAYIGKIKTWVNSVRFLIEPLIKNEYVYITDIDVMNLIPNFFEAFFIDMSTRISCYSNLVRSGSTRLTGVHFSKWECLYPVKLPKGFDYMMNDEMILYRRVKELGVKIDNKTRYRPLFGIHMSLSTDCVSGC